MKLRVIFFSALRLWKGSEKHDWLSEVNFRRYSSGTRPDCWKFGEKKLVLEIFIFDRLRNQTEGSFIKWTNTVLLSHLLCGKCSCLLFLKCGGSFLVLYCEKKKNNKKTIDRILYPLLFQKTKNTEIFLTLFVLGHVPTYYVRLDTKFMLSCKSDAF